MLNCFFGFFFKMIAKNRPTARPKPVAGRTTKTTKPDFTIAMNSSSEVSVSPRHSFCSSSNFCWSYAPSRMLMNMFSSTNTKST